MSEKELKKWESKLKFWLVMNGMDHPFNYGELCRNKCSDTCLLRIKKLRFNGKHVFISKDKFDYWCVEWIKHV